MQIAASEETHKLLTGFIESEYPDRVKTGVEVGCIVQDSIVNLLRYDFHDCHDELEKIYKSIEQQQESAREVEERFLAAWKKGIELAPRHLFECEGCGSVQDATDKEQLRPNGI